MNGANSLEESDLQPMNLCPMDLHKLHLVVGCDIIQRYKNLLSFYQTVEGFEQESNWITEYLQAIENPPPYLDTHTSKDDEKDTTSVALSNGMFAVEPKENCRHLKAHNQFDKISMEKLAQIKGK